MNGTLFALDVLNSGAGFMMAGLIGILFGLFLEQAGFGSSRKLTGIFYFQDMSVLKVMFTAVAVALIGYRYLLSFGLLDPGQVYLLDTYWLAQAIGGLLFGVGFVMGGWCPGTAIVGLASAKLDAAVFIVGILMGSMLFNETFTLLTPIYEGFQAGPISLPEVLKMTPDAVTAAIALIAVAAFCLSTWIEKQAPGKNASASPHAKGHLAGGAVLVGLAFLLLAVPDLPSGSTVSLVRKTHLTKGEEAGNPVDPEGLAVLIMNQTPGLVVVDLRPQKQYEAFHIRGAVSIPLDTIGINTEDRLPRQSRIILYSEDTTRAAQAWVQLREWGWGDVQVLLGGLEAFWRECLTPPSFTALMDEETANRRMATYTARRAFFLGDR